MSAATFSAEDQHWMQEALQLAQFAAQQNEVPVGAVLVQEGQLIGKGWNQPIIKNDPTAHAEMMALRDGALTLKNYRLPNTILYVTLEPCMMCAAAMVHARIKQVVFAASETKTGVCHSAIDFFSQTYLNHRVEWAGGLLALQSIRLMQSFFQARRRSKRLAQ